MNQESWLEAEAEAEVDEDRQEEEQGGEREGPESTHISIRFSFYTI